MGLPTITRGQGWRDDTFTPTANWSGGGTLTTDGDVGTFGGGTNTWTNTGPVNLLTATYPNLLVRSPPPQTIYGGLITVQYSDSSNDQFTITNGTGLHNYSLTTGKTINSVQVTSPPSSTLGLDFLIFYKEKLTLPTAIQPIQFRKQRSIVEIPILQREGGQVQDLGSLSPEVTVAGGLVSTTSGQSGWTNTYTADQWWQLLYGLTLEAGTIQADGNPTWQWFTSDQIQGKMIPRGTAHQQVPGRIGYHNYTLSLKQFDVNAETTSNLLGVTY
jgi:hypothetical protein